MKLSDLLSYRFGLDQFNFNIDSQPFIKRIREAKAHVDAKVSTETNKQILFGAGVYQDEMDRDLLRVQESIGELNDNLEYYKKQLDEIILERKLEHIEISEKRYIREELPQQRRAAKERTLKLEVDQFYDRVSQLSDWRYPGMLINCQEKLIIDEMASSDPLYLLDLNQTTLDERLDTMNSVYRYRVRSYEIDRFIPRRKYFGGLPTAQFGLIVVWNTLNNLPMSLCKQVLSQLFDLLRPGGTVLFTYNDCDNSLNVRNFESNFRSFVPGSQLIPVLEEIGYIVTNRGKELHSWMEIKKPGTLVTVKGGQALAQIILGRDPAIKEAWSNEEINKLHKRAIKLGIDTPSNINSHVIEPKKLQELVYQKEAELKLLGEVKLKEAEEAKLKLIEEIKSEDNYENWNAKNKGYKKDTVVQHGNKVWLALKDIGPKQRFDEVEWCLVK